MSDAVTTAPVAQPARPLFTKVPRENLVTLAVETDPCPQALLRVLGMIAQQGSAPLSIAAERTDDAQHVAVTIQALPEDRLAVLLARLESIVTVRAARSVPGGVPAMMWG